MDPPSFRSLQKQIEVNNVTRRWNPELPNTRTLGRRVKEIDLSESQKRILVLQNNVPNSTAYTKTIALSTETGRDIDNVLQDMVRRHPILLASYDLSRNDLAVSPENMSTVIQPHVTVGSMSELRAYIIQNKPAFNLTNGVLSQMKIISCGRTKVLVIYVHHIIADDITIQNLKRTLKMLLQSPTLNVQRDSEDRLLCSSLIDSEKEYMKSEEFAADKLFWELEFEECPNSSSLSFRNLADISRFEAYTAVTNGSLLPISSHESIERFCKLHGTTKFQVFLALFILVLQQYLASKEIVIAIPVTNRDVKTMEDDGMFENIVLFRYSINMKNTLEEHILNVGRKWETVSSHSRYPLNRMNGLIFRKFGKHVASLCRAMFDYNTFDDDCEELRIDAKHAKTEIFISISENAESCVIQCEHSAELIDEGVSRRFLRTLTNVCNQFKNLCDLKPLNSLEFLAEEELKTLEDFSGLGLEIDENASESVYEMFVRNTKSTPSKPALINRGQTFTFRDIMDLSDDIADQIFNCVDSNAIERSSRKGHTVPYRDKYVNNSKYKVVCLKKRSDHAVAEIDTQKLLFVPKLGSPAYLIQTSGSTGKPKKIRISQMSLSILAAAWTKVFELQKAELSVLQWATMSFDVCIADIVRGLCCTAGKVCICPDDKRLDIDYIKEIIVKEHITFAEFTPQFALALVENSSMEGLKSFRMLVLGSDTFHSEVYRKIKACLQRGQRLFNSYGMSEATIDSSYFEAESLPITRGGTVPIGKPFPGVRMKVLEPETLRLCPVGTIGELCIGGPVLGSGDTEIVQLSSGENMLKTNDRACWLPSGNLEVFGRLDSICKLRGFRISTTEIENTILMACSFVKDVTVAVLIDERDGSQMQFLCVFVVLEKHKKPSETGKLQIIHSIKARHPYYMVPDLITSVDCIPLTANGKVNRAALPSVLDILDLNIPEISEENETSGTVKILRQIFAETLRIDSSHVDSKRTFFEQGGNSLLLVQFYSLVKRKTAFDFSISDIFTYPSLESLASYLDIKSGIQKQV